MSYMIPELDAIGDQLLGAGKVKKPKILVVDDEPDNLDLLYRTFRREFQVLKASSGLEALSVLTSEGEVAVIISDQRMPEMKGTEFLSKTVPQFPNTMRIILTGFTDVEDLVEAINSGQVYKYITKPWDPNELRDVVRRATETYEFLCKRTDELNRAQIQAFLLKTLVGIPQESETLIQCLEKLAAAFGENFSADQCVLRKVVGAGLGEERGEYVIPDRIAHTLDDDPLVQDAIATKSIRLFVKASAQDHVDYYSARGIATHLVMPLLHKETPFTVLSLQWPEGFVLAQEDVSMLHLLSNHLALALAYAGS